MPETQAPNFYPQQVKKVLWIVLILNLLVFAIELFAGIVTRSLSIFSDAAHTMIDSSNNILGLVVLTLAAKPPDKEHPYGHGKFETLAAFAIVAFLAITCIEIIQASAGRLLHPVKLPLFNKGVLFLLFITLVLNLIIWSYERFQGIKLKSSLLLADSSHTGSDILVKLSVIGSQFFIAREMYWVDPLIAILITFFIAKAGYEILMRTLPVLVDGVWLDPEVIRKSATEVDGIISCYEIYSRQSPYTNFIECKIKVIPKDLYGAHKVADKVEEKLKQDFGDCKITVHVEP